MAKAFKAFRFDPELYARFKKLVGESGLTVTEALERFMETCVSAGLISFPTASKGGVEAEARVLLAWLRKGKWFYYSPAGEEDQSVESRLLALLSQVQDEDLRGEIEEDLKRLSVPSEWQERADRATKELLNLSEEKRSAFLESHSRIWQDLKSAMEELSNRKCWYCEGRTARFDFHVDHHRPKNRVRNKDGTKEAGYWWLAFDFRNFRLACDYCDSSHAGTDGITRGKADQFPLAQNRPRHRLRART